MKKEKVPFLPEEIMSNIFKRLSVKSLIRFQRFCKYWRNIINSSFFITDHLRHPANQNHSVLFARYRPPADQSRSVLFTRCADPLDVFMVDTDEMRARRDVQKPPSISNLPNASIIGSCNGLICVRTGSRLFLWNPAIGEVRWVPGATNDDHDDDDVIFGFGFSPVLNDYKIVKILIPHDEIERVEAYSLRTDSWREIELGKLIRVPGFRRDVLNVSANGSIFWYVAGDEDDWQKRLVSFDMAKEVFRLVNLPVETRHSYVLILLVHREELVCFSSSPVDRSNEEHNEIGFRKDMWMTMKDDEKLSWKKIDKGDPFFSLFYGHITTMIFREIGVACLGLFGESLVPILKPPKAEN